MKRPEPDSPEARERAQAAADWLVKHDRGLTPVEQDAFFEWLAADPRHADWLALHRSLVGDFNVLTQWRPEHSEEPNPDLLAPPRARMWRVLPWAFAAAAALAVGIMTWLPGPEGAVQEIVAGSDLERRVLEDGSTIDLNVGAVVTVLYSANERRVNLERGEALFTVAKNPTRPFVVRAGSIDLLAVGTAFNVRLAQTGVELLVTEGQVQVDTLAAPAGTAADTGRRPATAASPRVVAGQRATMPHDGAAPEIVAISPQETARLLAWQPRLLDFSGAPLASALAEFNRHNRVQFVLADADLAALPIVASIRSDKIDAFAAFLAATPGLRIERRGETIFVDRRK